MSEITKPGGRGSTSIQDSVIAKIASLAAREVGGVAGLGGSISAGLGSLVGRIRGDEHRTGGVGVEVGQRQAAVDLTLQVTYPSPIAQVAEAVRNHVVQRLQSLTGLEVVEVNVLVTDLVFPGSQDAGSSRME